MINIFWVEYNSKTKDVIEFSYDNFLRDLNEKESVIVNYCGNSIYEYFINITLAIINNIDIEILDLDLSIEEIDLATNSNYKEKRIKISDSLVKSIEQIIEKINSSKSNITLLTSGTTGLPKSISQPVSNLIREVRFGKKYTAHVWGFGYNVTHVAGLQLYFQGLLNKNTLVYLHGVNKEKILYFISRYSITNIAGTPSFYRLLMPIITPLETIEKITLGGEKADEKLISNLNLAFPNSRINNVYASTEFGSILSSSGSFFKISSKYEKFVKIVNNRIYVHKSLVGQSNDIRFTEEDWYDTGDLVEYIDQEQFRVVGRSNEMINVGGNKVNPQEVEEIISTYQGIQECKVFGRKNSVLGTIICVELVVKDELEFNEIQFKQFLSSKLQNFKVPRKVYLVSNIKKGKSGKIERKNE